MFTPTPPPNAPLVARLPKVAYNAREQLPMARVDFLKQVPLFDGLKDAEFEALAKDFVQLQFHSGEMVFQQGDPGEALYLIESGQVRIFVAGDEGQESSVNLFGPGDVFGELAVIDDLPRSASVTAMDMTVVHRLTRAAFRDHMRRAPQLALNFMRALSVRLRYSTQQMGNLALLDVPSRLARKLIELAETHGVSDPQGTRLNLTLTQSDLASLIGTTRESINKALGTFKRRGFIHAPPQGPIIITDLEALRELGD